MTRHIVAGALLGVLAFIAFALSLPFAGPAEARGLHPRCNIDWPCAEPPSVNRGRLKIEVSSKAERREARRIARGQRLEQAMPFGKAITDPTPGAAARFIRGRLVCARNVNAFLAANGISGTDSARAKSFLTWGRGSPVPIKGAVAVFNRGRQAGTSPSWTASGRTGG